MIYLGNTNRTLGKLRGVVNRLIGRTNDKTSISEKFKIKNKITNDANYISNEFCIFFLQTLVKNMLIKYQNQNLPTTTI